MLRAFENIMIVAFIALIAAMALQFAMAYPVPILAVATLVAGNFLWPYLRDDGRRHMVFLPDGSQPFYDRRIWAVMAATWGYLFDKSRRDNGFPRIDDFWESHLPN